MLQDIRDNAQSTVAKVIVGLIVLTFALFGVDSIVGGFGGEPEVAVVNGNEIKEIEFLRAVDIKKRQILGQMGENADPTLIDDQLLKKSVLEGLIDQEILLQDALEQGVYISGSAIDGLITGINQFKVDGQFNNDLFLASIRNFGMTTNTFKESIKKEVLISQPRNAIVATSFVLDSEFDRVIEIDRQTRNYSVIKFVGADYLNDVTVDESEITEFYESNKSDYITPESVDVEYVQLDKNALLDRIDVSEAELKKLYEQELEGFEAAEERNASHILIEINDEVSDSQARQKIEEVSVKLAEGESFEALAKEYSDDVGSAAQGGSLGFTAKGAFLPEFDDALFALSEGEVSQPVLTEYGYHLIKLHEIQVQEIPAFEEMKYSLDADAKSEKVEALYVELSEKLADLSYASSDLSEPAEEIGLKVKSHENVSALSSDGIFANPKVKKSIFSPEVLEERNNSDLIEITNDSVIVLRIANHYPSTQKELAAVKDDIVEKLKSQKATIKATEEAQTIVQNLKSGTGLESGVEWEIFSDVKRNDAGISPELIKLVFSMPNQDGELSVSGKEIGGDYYIVRLDAVNVPEVESIEVQERKTIERVVGSGLGNAEYQIYQTSLKSKADIEKI